MSPTLWIAAVAPEEGTYNFFEYSNRKELRKAGQGKHNWGTYKDDEKY
jgi:hypothetical protein